LPFLSKFRNETLLLGKFVPENEQNEIALNLTSIVLLGEKSCPELARVRWLNFFG
jgi:hypothetical protein